MRIILLVQVLVCFFSTSAAFAYDSRFEINPKIDLQKLTALNQPLVTSYRNGAVLYVDASAILHVDIEKLTKVSADYNRYVEMKLPNLEKSAIVEKNSAGDLLYIFSHMTVDVGPITKDSKHYLEVRLEKDLNSKGGRGSQWQQVPRAKAWPFGESSQFSRLDGSWYMQPLKADANGRPNVYVRYFLAADFDTSAPDFLVDKVAKSKLASGVRGVIEALAKAAALRQ